MLLRAFLVGLSQFLASLLNAAWPSLNTAGLQFGMFVGLVTPVPYATIDHPDVTNQSYWKGLTVLFGRLTLRYLLHSVARIARQSKLFLVF